VAQVVAAALDAARDAVGHRRGAFDDHARGVDLLGGHAE
jgi:hypothetical protein